MSKSTSTRRKGGAKSAGSRGANKHAASASKETVAAKAGGLPFVRITDALSKGPGVTFNEGKGFGSRALKVHGKIFAMMTSRNEFVVKLAKERVEEFVAQDVGDYFDAGKGKPMKEWLSVFGAPKSSIDLAREAYRFVEGAGRKS